MEETQPRESVAKRAIRALLGKKPETTPFDPNSEHIVRAAKDRVEQLQSGVTPKEGRGSCGGTSRLPDGMHYLRHVGNKQRERNLRQCWAQFEKICAKDAWYATTRERLLDAVAEDPNPEYQAMNIALGSKLASDTKKEWLRQNPPPPNAPPMVAGTEWVDALNVALNHFEEVADRTKAEAAADGAVL